MINLPLDILNFIIKMLDKKDQFSIRKTCRKFLYLVDNSYLSLRNGYTFKEEIIRFRLARSIRNLMLSDVDISHPIYIKQLNNETDIYDLTEDDSKPWIRSEMFHLKYWRRPLRQMTREEMIKRSHNKIYTWLLLFNNWINSSLNDRLDEAENKCQEIQFCTFWGVNQDTYYCCSFIGESPLGHNGLYSKSIRDNMTILSDLPKWVIQELYPLTVKNYESEK